MIDTTIRDSLCIHAVDSRKDAMVLDILAQTCQIFSWFVWRSTSKLAKNTGENSTLFGRYLKTHRCRRSSDSLIETGMVDCVIFLGTRIFDSVVVMLG